MEHPAGARYQHGSPALVVKQEPKASPKSAILVKSEPVSVKSEPTSTPQHLSFHQSTETAQARSPAQMQTPVLRGTSQPARHGQSPTALLLGTADAQQLQARPPQKRQKTAEAPQSASTSITHQPFATPTSQSLSQSPPVVLGASKQPKSSVQLSPVFHSQQQMDQSSAAPLPSQATGEHAGWLQQPSQTQTKSFAPVPPTSTTTDPLRPAGPASLHKHASESLPQPCESQLQVSLLPDRQYEMLPAVGGSKVPDHLQSKFATGSA